MASAPTQCSVRLFITHDGGEPTILHMYVEGRILERGLRKALTERDGALRDPATAARWVDRSAFGKEEGFGQAHQSLLKALDKASQFV